VRELKQEVRELSLTAQALDRAIDACLDDDEDMARMYLSRLHSAARGVAPAPPQTALRRRATEETLAKFSSATPMQTPPPHTPLPAGSLRQVGRSASLLSSGGAEGDEEDLEEHEEVEMLLESYAQEVGSTLGALEAIARSTEREGPSPCWTSPRPLLEPLRRRSRTRSSLPRSSSLSGSTRHATDFSRRQI